MADNTSYTIYLKSVGGENGGSNKQTSPKTTQNKMTSPDENEKTSFMAGFKNFATNTKRYATTAQSAIKKFLPIAITVAAVKIIDQATTFLLPFYTTATGDYAFQNNYNNFKQTVNNIFNPIQTFINYQKTKQQIAVFNQNVSEQRLLLGDSTINYNFGRGINV